MPPAVQQKLRFSSYNDTIESVLKDGASREAIFIGTVMDHKYLTNPNRASWMNRVHANDEWLKRYAKACTPVELNESRRVGRNSDLNVGLLGINHTGGEAVQESYTITSNGKCDVWEMVEVEVALNALSTYNHEALEQLFTRVPDSSDKAKFYVVTRVYMAKAWTYTRDVTENDDHSTGVGLPIGAALTLATNAIAVAHGSPTGPIPTGTLDRINAEVNTTTHTTNEAHGITKTEELKAAKVNYFFAERVKWANGVKKWKRIFRNKAKMRGSDDEGEGKKECEEGEKDNKVEEGKDKGVGQGEEEEDEVDDEDDDEDEPEDDELLHGWFPFPADVIALQTTTEDAEEQ